MRTSPLRSVQTPIVRIFRITVVNFLRYGPCPFARIFGPLVVRSFSAVFVFGPQGHIRVPTFFLRKGPLVKPNWLPHDRVYSQCRCSATTRYSAKAHFCESFPICVHVFAPKKDLWLSRIGFLTITVIREMKLMTPAGQSHQ